MTPPRPWRWCESILTAGVDTRSRTHLIQRLVYAELGSARQARYHRVVGEALEDDRPGPPGLPGERAGPSLGERHQDRRSREGDRLLQAGGGRGVGWAGSRRRACGITTQALDLLDRLDEPDKNLPVGPPSSVWAQRSANVATRNSGGPWWGRHGWRRRSGTRTVVAAALLANTRGTFEHRGSQLDGEKVAILAPAAAEQLPEHPTRDPALLLAFLQCSELTVGEPTRAAPTPRRRGSLAIAEANQEDAVTVLGAQPRPGSLGGAGPSLAASVERTTSVTRTCPVVSVTRHFCVPQPVVVATAPAARAMSRRWTVVSPSPNHLWQRLDQPFMVWVETLQRSDAVAHRW